MSYELVERKTDQTNSVEVSRTSKGDYSWNIKIYCTEGGFEQALAEVRRTDQSLRNTYLADGEHPRLEKTEAAGELPGPKKPVRHEVHTERPLEEEEEKPREREGKKRRSKEELVATARKPFLKIKEEPEEEEAPAPTFRRRKRHDE